MNILFVNANLYGHINPTLFALSKAPVPEQMLIKGNHPQLDHCYEILERISKKFDIEQFTMERIFVGKGDLNIVYTTPGFNIDQAVNKSEYLFAGPSLDRKQEQSKMPCSIESDRKVIYISLGSINTDFADFYKLCLSAFSKTEYYVYMSIGRKINVADLGVIPSNFTIQNFLPQLDILKYTDVFITHAGFNSVNEAIYYGVPMLAFPIANDQHMVAKRIAELSLGITASIKEITYKELQQKVEIILNNEQYRSNCKAFSIEMHKQARLQQVVEKLVEYIGTYKCD